MLYNIVNVCVKVARVKNSLMLLHTLLGTFELSIGTFVYYILY